MIILPPVMFIGGPTRKGRTGIIQVFWDPEILVSVITMVGIPVEEDLADIVIKTRNMVIHMECDGDLSWVNFLGELWQTQSVHQWVDCLTNL